MRSNKRDGPGRCGGARDHRHANAAVACAPDLGRNVHVIAPAMSRAAVQARVDAIFARQERAHFTDARFAVSFRPGRYALDLDVGFVTQVAGLGRRPGEVAIDGHVHAEADWAKGMALVDFWRGVENLSVCPPNGRDRWAASQAAPYRHVDLSGDLSLDDGGWSSGGFMVSSAALLLVALGILAASILAKGGACYLAARLAGRTTAPRWASAR